MKIPSSLKVDNLRHIHDHGLAVEFTDPKLVTLLTYLRAKEGVTELKAGNSTLRVTTLGNVTKTEAYWSVGSYHRAAIHYYHAADNLKFSLHRQNSDDHREAFNALNAVIFGDELAKNRGGIFSVSTGAGADRLNAWLKKFAWVITGTNGLRGQALAVRLAHLANVRRDDASRYATSEARWKQYANEATPDFFRAKHAEAREKLAAKLAQIEKEVAAMKEQETQALAAPDGKALRDIVPYGFGVLPDHNSSVYYFPATSDKFSHEVKNANYAATVSPDGTITLSSGIRCEFTAPKILAWLRGEAPAPQTRYGTVERREVAKPDGTPLVLLKCGCHWVDASGVSQEFAQLLTPTHTVTRVPGTPRADFGTPQFTQILRNKYAERFAQHETLRADAIRAFADRRAYLTKEETDLPATIAALAAKKDADAASLAASEKALADAKTRSPLGADGETLHSLAAFFLRSQSYHPAI